MKPNGVWDPDTIMLSERYELALDHLSLSIKGVSYEDRGRKHRTHSGVIQLTVIPTTPNYRSELYWKMYATHTGAKTFEVFKNIHTGVKSVTLFHYRTGVKPSFPPEHTMLTLVSDLQVYKTNL